MFWIKLYLLTLPVFFAIDMLWLGLIAKNFYRAELGSLLRTDFNWIAAIAFYLLFIGGILYFAVAPALSAGDWKKALIAGALFGFLSYATYDLTNLATLRDWSMTVTLVDLAWGAILSAAVASASYRIALFLQS